MKIKIGNKIYDTSEIKKPIMIILSSVDKTEIKRMGRKDHKICYLPFGMTKNAIKKFEETN